MKHYKDDFNVITHTTQFTRLYLVPTLCIILVIGLSPHDYLLNTLAILAKIEMLGRACVTVHNARAMAVINTLSVPKSSMGRYCWHDRRVLWPPEQEIAIMTSVVLRIGGPCHTHHP
jgi:hypothetical protein